MVFFMIRGANVTFRHFFFLYPELVLMAVYVLWEMSQRKNIGRIIESAVCLQAIICVVLIIVGHPFQNTYFNILAGRNVEERFEYANTDCYKEALEQILKMDEGDDILVSSDNWNCYYGIKQAWEILNPEKKKRIRIAEPETKENSLADYHVYGQSILEKENLEIKQGVTERDLYVPEEKYNSKKCLGAYGKTVITIYYND